MKWVAAFAAAAGIGAYGGYWYAGDLVSSANSRTEMARSQTDLRNDIIAGLKEELAKCQAQRGVDSPPQPEAPAAPSRPDPDAPVSTGKSPMILEPLKAD